MGRFIAGWRLKALQTARARAFGESFRGPTRKAGAGTSKGEAGSKGVGRKGNNSQPRTSSLHSNAIATERSLWKIKLAYRAKSFWYPYATLRNVPVLERLLATVGLSPLELCRGEYGKIMDIGAADGDLAFFLEKIGLSVGVIDNESTNFNGLEGARILRAALNSSVRIQSVDLDSQFPLFGNQVQCPFSFWEFSIT